VLVRLGLLLWGRLRLPLGGRVPRLDLAPLMLVRVRLRLLLWGALRLPLGGRGRSRRLWVREML